MAGPVTRGGLGVRGGGMGLMGLGASQEPQPFAFPAMPSMALPYVAHLYNNGMQFKRTLGDAASVGGAAAGSALVTKPGLKMTLNGGYHPITLELAGAQSPANLILDPGFEVDDVIADVQVNWALTTPGEWALMSTATDMRGGRRGMKCTRTNLGPSNWNDCGSKVLIPVIPGQTYTASVWSKQTAGAQGSHGKVSLYDITGAGFTNVQPMTSQNGVKPWTFYTLSFIVPSNCFFATLDCMAGWWDGVTGANAQTWYDDGRLVLGTDSTDPIVLGDVITLTEQGQGSFPGLIEGFEVADTVDATLPAGWQHNNVGTGTSTLAANPHTGAKALALTNPSAGNYGGIFRRQGIALPSNGGTLQLAIWGIGSGAGTSGPFRITFANRGALIDEQGRASAQPSAQGGVKVSDRNLTVTAGYLNFTDSVPIPAGYSWAFVELYANGSGAPATFYVDDIDIPIVVTDPGVLYTGIVEETPDEVGAGPTSSKHQVNLTPLVAELGDTDFNQQYSTLTDVAQMVRDAVNKTGHLRVTPQSCGDSGVLAIYNFNTTTCLEVLNVAKRIAGVNFWWFVDATGLVWFQSTTPTNPARLTLKRGSDFTRRRSTPSIVGLKNKVQALGGYPPGSATPLKSTYSNAVSQKAYRVRALDPGLVFPTVTDQGTLDKIVNTVGAALDRIQNHVEVDLPAYASRLTLGVPGGLTARLQEQASEAVAQPKAIGTGGFQGPYVAQDIEVVGGQQKVLWGDIPITGLRDLQYELDRIVQRVSALPAAY